MTQPESTPNHSSAGPQPAAEDRSSRALLQQNLLLAKIAGGGRLDTILETVCRSIEEQIPGLHCCIMTYDEASQRLSVGAAPNLPAPFLGAIDGLAIGPAPGSCNQAIVRDEPVFSTDIAKDPIWDGLRASAVEQGIAACWSYPVREIVEDERERSTRLLGTVAFYFGRRTDVSEAALQALEMASTLASLAIQTATARQRLGHEKFYDSLTGLPNRRLFRQHLKQTLTDARPHERKMAVLLLDLDHFKDVNDTFGFTVGDFLLRSVAERLTKLRKPADILSRFGDDEFGMLISEVGENDEIREIASQILDTINQPHDFSGHQLAVTASLGASVYPWDGEDGQTLLRNSENALYAAKRHGRNRFRVYAPTMAGNAFEKLQLKLALGYALENQELELRYQPKVRGDGEIIGCEALLYWNHPSEGVLSPGRFIPLAEESGQILQLGRWVLETACAQLRRWKNAGFDLHIAINISALQFREPGFVDGIAAVLSEHQVDPSAIELEITETVAMTEVQKTMTRLAELRKLGLSISIDDFGTGYSSLSYLKRFPISTLKIDQSFVRNLPEDKENAAIVKAVIALANLMSLSVVAEGVETSAQLQFLEQNGCEIFQGYHYSPPMSVSKFSTLLQQGLDRATGRSYLRGQPAS